VALTIQQLTDLIISKLTAALPAVVVESLPVDPDILGSPVTENQIWVALDSISADDPGGAMVKRTTFTQSESWSFTLVLRLFDLYSPTRDYTVIETIRNTLSGVGSGSMNSSPGLYMERLGFREFADGLYLYQMVWAIGNQYVTTVKNT
jgi:hypothetical protein